MSIQAQVLTAGTAVQSASVDNAVATATVPAIAGMTNKLLGFSADYDIAVAAIKSVTVTADVTVVYLWDFANGPFHLPLPGPIPGAFATAITVALEASGTGGTSGRVVAYFFPY